MLFRGLGSHWWSPSILSTCLWAPGSTKLMLGFLYRSMKETKEDKAEAQEECRNVLGDHAYPLTNKDSKADLLLVVQGFVRDHYSSDVGVLMMTDNSDRQFLRVTSKRPDQFLIDDSVLHLNIRVSSNSQLQCQLLTHNRQLYRETQLDRERMVEVGSLIDALSKDSYMYCEGIALDHAQLERNIQNDKSYLSELLIEKYDKNIIYR